MGDQARVEAGLLTALLPQLRAALEADGFEHLEELPGGEGVWARVSAEGRSWPFLALVDEEERVVVCYSVVPGRVPPERRGEAAELIARLNSGLLAGAFELDVEDGEVRLRTSLDLGREPLHAGLVPPLVGRNLAVAVRHFPDLDEVMAQQD